MPAESCARSAAMIAEWEPGVVIVDTAIDERPGVPAVRPWWVCKVPVKKDMVAGCAAVGGALLVGVGASVATFNGVVVAGVVGPDGCCCRVVAVACGAGACCACCCDVGALT